MTRTLFKDVIDALIVWWKRVWFESKLTARLKMIELENQVEAEQELKDHLTPVYTEDPVDPSLQTGDAAKLGGAMRLSARWNVSTDETDKSN